MKNYFKSEFKRAFFSKNTLISIIIVFICLIIPYLSEIKIPYPNEDGINFFIRIGAFLSISFLPLLAPLVACIPFSNSYILDKESGVINYIYAKIDSKKYFTIKIIVNGLVSGLIFLIPQLIMLLFLILFHGMNSSSIEIVGAFSTIYYSSKSVYAIILIFVEFIFGFIFSTLALGISALTENKYLTIIIPFIYVMISGTVFEIIGLNRILNLNVITLFDISYSTKMTSLSLIVYDIIIFLVGSGLLYYFGEQKRYE